MSTYELIFSAMSVEEQTQSYDQQATLNITLRAFFACCWLYVCFFAVLAYDEDSTLLAYILSFTSFSFAPTIWLRIYYHSLVSRLRDFGHYSAFCGNRIIEVWEEN